MSSFGPGFQEAGSKLYRAEYATISVVVLGYLIWRSVYVGGIDWLQVIFWAALPDLAAFIPIGASPRRKEWPSWGPGLYNFFHNILIWALLFGMSLWVFRAPYWETFGWLAHITADRAVGYGLRAGITRTAS